MVTETRALAKMSASLIFFSKFTLICMLPTFTKKKSIVSLVQLQFRGFLIPGMKNTFSYILHIFLHNHLSISIICLLNYLLHSPLTNTLRDHWTIDPLCTGI